MAHVEDKRGILEKGIFDYKVLKDNRIFIYWNNKQVTILSGKDAEKFINRIKNATDFEKQLVMAKVTGN